MFSCCLLFAKGIFHEVFEEFTTSIMVPTVKLCLIHKRCRKCTTYEYYSNSSSNGSFSICSPCLHPGFFLSLGLCSFTRFQIFLILGCHGTLSPFLARAFFLACVRITSFPDSVLSKDLMTSTGKQSLGEPSGVCVPSAPHFSL